MAMGTETPCTPEMKRFFQCLVQEPVAHWECAPDGVAAIQDGFCQVEQRNTVVCMQTKMK
jgi:hypothetical protein